MLAGQRPGAWWQGSPGGNAHTRGEYEMERNGDLGGCRRIVVVGSTSAGKTWMARLLAQRLGLPHTELDALYWEPNWTPAATERFRARVIETLSGDAWVVDGNYSPVRDVVWQRACTLIWLDYSLPLILWRLLRRTLRRTAGRELLWNGNRESWRSQFLSRDSLFVWVLQTYRRRRREYPRFLMQPEYAHLHVVHLRSPQAAEAWLLRLSPAPRLDHRQTA